ncbi:MAG: hypothetical protein LQ352_006900 [Teloschistes flavicans]|nr:MAG: hypothetical protein LQ352_006900 [Teloschistes flavicans]
MATQRPQSREKSADASCRLRVIFIDKEGAEHTFEVSAGDNLMDIAQAEDLEVEGPFAHSLRPHFPSSLPPFHLYRSQLLQFIPLDHSITPSLHPPLLRTTTLTPPPPTGACGGSCACSTCHMIVESSDLYDAMPEPSDDENDMLDLAFGLTETSRLGCQVKMAKEIDGVRVRLPSMTRNMQAGDFSGGKKKEG